MKMVILTLALMCSVVTGGWMVRQSTCEKPRHEMTKREKCRALVGRQGQPRHWRGCMVKPR
jgi:hypothetical protein